VGDPCKDRDVTEDRVPQPPDDRDAGDSDPAEVADAGTADVADAGAGDARESAYELLQRGQALLRGRHHAQAAVVLERAARLEPGKASILEALGRAYFNSGQHDAARETFEALLELDPSAHYAQFGLGQSLKKLGREREAWVHLRLAVALSPGTPLYRQALARIPDPKAAAGADEDEDAAADG
jgi:tetratricopeptide (TPR) repeat protein